MTRDVLLAPADNIRLVELCGPLDEHLRLIESRLGVEVRRRGNRPSSPIRSWKYFEKEVEPEK